MIELRILRKQLDGGVYADQLQYRATKAPGRFIDGMGWIEPPENKWQGVPVVTEDPSIK